MKRKPEIKLYQVTAPDFTAGFTVDNCHTITQTAPILKKFRGQTIDSLLVWCKKNKFKVEFIEDQAYDED